MSKSTTVLSNTRATNKCPYCLGIEQATPASPRKKYIYCPMCGIDLRSHYLGSAHSYDLIMDIIYGSDELEDLFLRNDHFNLSIKHLANSKVVDVIDRSIIALAETCKLNEKLTSELIVLHVTNPEVFHTKEKLK